MKTKIKKKKGSALIVAVLLASIIGGAAVGIAAVSTRQVKISEAYNKGTLAFYAAESGLEQGLLYYKHSSNQEIPKAIDISETKSTLQREPLKAYRNFLKPNDIRPDDAVHGVNVGYSGSVRDQVYDLQVYYKQKYFGDDKDGSGQIDPADISATGDTKYQILKDDAASIDILEENNNIYLYWKWAAACNVGGGVTPHPRGLEIKIKTKEINPISNKNEYTIVLRDSRCGSQSIAAKSSLETDAVGAPSAAGVFWPGAELKSKMGIASLTATNMTIKPVGNTAASNDSIFFGFNQVATGTNHPSIRTSGPFTTIKSTGYYNGTTRQITANINRQSGTIADIFQYVLYQGCPTCGT